MKTGGEQKKHKYEINEQLIVRNIGNNLRKLCEAAGYSQAEFAKITGTTEPTLSNFLKGVRPPSIAYLVNLCSMKQFFDMGLELHLEDFIGESFDPMYVINMKHGISPETKKQLRRGDFVGTYMCYFFDQTKQSGGRSHNLPRELRYGVLSVYDDYNGVNGDVKACAIAAFYKEGERSQAESLKQSLDLVYAENTTVEDRNNAIRGFFKDKPGLYDGEVEFSERHTFVSINSHAHGDYALIVLYSPQKRTDSDFIGGIGSVASIAHGSIHMPSAQRMIISKYELKCSEEVIAEHLKMSGITVDSTDESEELCRLCRKLYDPKDTASEFLEESDKTAMLTNRLNRLISKYVEKNVCCVSTVSEEDDKKVFALIKEYSE